MKRYRFDFHILFLFIILFIVFLLVFLSVQKVDYRAAHDEGYYLRYADYISNNGLGGFRDLFSGYIRDQESWVFPNPLRIGYILLSSLWVRLLGSSFYTLSHLSFFSYLLFISINYYFCRRLFDREKAILLALLIAFSPINMAMARRALSESVATLFLGLSIWLFLDILHKDKGIIKRFIFSIVFSYTIMVKETNILLVIPFIVYLVIYKIHFKEKLNLTNLQYIFIYPVFLVALAYILLSGDVFSVIKVAKIILSSPGTNEYAIRFGSGPWSRYIIDYMVLSPWVLILSIGYIFHLLQNFRKSDSKEAYFLVILLALFLLFNLFTKNVRYVMILDLPIRLFFILMLYRLISIKSEKTKFALAAVIVMVICLADFITYSDIFIVKGIYDPVSAWLLQARGI